MAGNSNLTRAGKDKNDEFYTRLTDIEKELRYYRKHFKGKTVFCNCDDPFESNFFKYFVLNFNGLGLKKLIATCYTTSPVAHQQISLFDIIGGSDENKNKPYKAVVTKVYDATGDGGIGMLDIKELFLSGENELTELKGDGDFRSDECIELLEESDIVVTNPPFSLFREYVAQLVEYEKKFIIWGNNNAVTYKEIFPLLKENKIWLGNTANKTLIFQLSPDYQRWDEKITEKMNDGNKYGKVPAISVFTNLDNKKRHEDLILVKKYNLDEYPKYDNYDAIEVSRVKNIPYDYDGVMGVPITFLDKHNPDQFEILGNADANVLPEDWQGASSQIVDDYYKQGNKGQISEGWRNPIYYDSKGKVFAPYKRILIRNKHPEINTEVN